MPTDIERLTRRQLLMREVNEQIEERTASAVVGDPKLFVCECDDEGCAEVLEITVAEYERVRRYPGRFAIKSGHEREEIDRIVEENARFLVVEKTGQAGALAEENDPRTP